MPDWASAWWKVMLRCAFAGPHQRLGWWTTFLAGCRAPLRWMLGFWNLASPLTKWKQASVTGTPRRPDE